MSNEPGNHILKEVSRSFYLSLRMLPRPMRGAASLGYLLARTSDTLADSSAASTATRLKYLSEFDGAVSGACLMPRWPLHLLNAIPDPRERRLLECAGDLLGWLGRLPHDEADLVRKVVATIIGGQKLDLERFSDANGEYPVVLENDAALEDYTWRVAGCVGAFWTKLGFLTLGEKFSFAGETQLMAKGVAYGKGLQLVNILRDLPVDLAAGRCYLPVANPADLDELMGCHARWIETAAIWTQEGEQYATMLRSKRLRAASGLPAFIAAETLEALRGTSWEGLQKRVKIPRSRVYRCMIRAFFQTPTRG